MPAHLSFLLAVVLAIASTCESFAAADARANRPNVVFLFADDMGWGDAACYGHPYAKTPSIDSLAVDGTRFFQCYATGVTCCPSRTGFMTSRFPARFAKYPANGGFADRVTITELLKKAGYATGHFGKWHIGPDTKPGTYGIDEINASDADTAPKKISDDARGRDSRTYDLAIRFIEKHKDEPFYINVWDHIPHHPVNPSQALMDGFGPLEVDKSKFYDPMQEKFAACEKLGGDVSARMRAYLAEIKSMDDDIGRLLKRIDELDLRDNTIVVFSSDQGAAPIFDPDKIAKALEKRKPKDNGGGQDGASKSKEPPPFDLRLNAMGNAGPFRGGKHSQYEGGVRIPFIVRWPGHVPAGRLDGDSVISGADWLPTLCTITGIAFDADDFDGENALAAWQGVPFLRTKPIFWKTSAPNSDAAVRIKHWKLHYPNSRRSELELYNVVTDPGEKNNLASSRADVVEHLSEAIREWQATLPKEYDKTDDGDK